MASMDSETATDPVCGMTVTIAGAANTTRHEGYTYYFCSPKCLAKFTADPGHYRLRNAAADRGGGLGGRELLHQPVQFVAVNGEDELVRVGYAKLDAIGGTQLAPLHAFVGLMNAPLRDFVGVLDARRRQLEQQEA